MLFFQRNGRRHGVQQQEQKIKPFFIIFVLLFFLWFSFVCLCCSCCCCLVILSQAIAAGQTALRLALLPATERTSARGTRDLCQAGETQHTIPHTHTHIHHKTLFFWFIVYSRWSGKYGIDQSHLLFDVGRPSAVWISPWKTHSHIYSRLSL